MLYKNMYYASVLFFDVLFNLLCKRNMQKRTQMPKTQLRIRVRNQLGPNACYLVLCIYYVATKATYIRLLHGKIGILEGFFGPSSVHRGRTHIMLG